MESSRIRTMVSRTWMILIPLMFYLFFWALDGAIICADTHTYIEMDYSREPLYPSLLAACRMLFGTDYLSIVALLQSVFAAFATYSIAAFISEEYKLSLSYKLGVLSMPLATSLLCRFAAGRASMYSNSILTEGITVSLYLIFFRFWLEYVIYGKSRIIKTLAFTAIIGIATRKQMYVLLALLIIGIIYRGIKEVDIHKSPVVQIIRRVVFCAGVTIIILVSARLIDCGYNYVIRGSFSTHAEDNRFVTTMAIYTADREFVEYIEPEFRELFIEIYDACDGKGYLMKDAPDGWYDSTTHFANHYDLIQLDTMETLLNARVNELEWDDSIRLNGDRLDAIRKSFNKSLLPHEVIRLLKVFLYSFFVGLVTTVAAQNKLLCIYALLIYLAYIILAVNVLKNKSACNEYREKAICLIFGVLVSIILNVALVSAVIFAQTRYTIYNMPLFYIAMIVMISEILVSRNRQ